MLNVDGKWVRQYERFQPVKLPDPKRVHPIVTEMTKRQNVLRMTTQTLAERAGVDVDTIRAWRRGTPPKLHMVAYVATVLGLKLTIVREPTDGAA